MNELDTWLESIESWYRSRKHDQVDKLEVLILTPPDAIWGPLISDKQSKAIACWLDGCLRIYTHYKQSSATPSGNAEGQIAQLMAERAEKAYQFVMFAYSKLQAVSGNTSAEPDLQEWCTKRMQHLCVLALEFANQQHDPRWQGESERLIESHVRFMTGHPHNGDQPSSPSYTH